jgi:glycogen debranching enzyme
MISMPGPWSSTASATLGGSLITLVEGSSFCISLPSGDMLAGLPHGLFFRDTRFLAELRLRVNGRLPEPLAAHVDDPFSATFVLQGVPEPGRADSHLVVTRHRYVGNGMREDIIVENFGDEPAFCGIDLEFACDFADLFEVKEERVEKAGSLSSSAEAGQLLFTYTRGTFRRATRIEFSETPRFAESASFEVIVPARDRWSLCVQVTPIIDGHEITPLHPCGLPVEHAPPIQRLEAWRQNLPRIKTGHHGFAILLERSTEDLASLRLFDPEHPDRAVVAAGAPWFMSLFGRDSLISSWMAMIVDTDLALGTLQTLARHQGRDVDPITEEEPGRILHEMRFGESARLSLGGGTIYYGSVDATPLFVMLLGELRRWRSDRGAVDALLPAADRALAWINDYGDRDGDGYVEYLRTSNRGLRNQGWKDSWDSTHFADGHLAEPPIALCEVQGYVYGALVARAAFAVETGDTELAEHLTARAAQLKQDFNRDFWLEDRGWYAVGLDRDKVPIDALTSNIGHCLWTGIVDHEKSALVARRLLSEELFSGWGVRTLASSMTRYNPVSYHNGSVWPHDNALCVAGLIRYGHVDEALRLTQGIVDAGHQLGDRLPELFGGFGRDEYTFPVPYPTSCSPQAWAAAAPLLLLRSLLGFEPDLPAGRLEVAPVLPEWLGRLHLEDLPIAGGRLSLEAEGDRLEAVDAPHGLTVTSPGDEE